LPKYIRVVYPSFLLTDICLIRLKGMIICGASSEGDSVSYSFQVLLLNLQNVVLLSPSLFNTSTRSSSCHLSSGICRKAGINSTRSHSPTTVHGNSFSLCPTFLLPNSTHRVSMRRRFKWSRITGQICNDFSKIRDRLPLVCGTPTHLKIWVQGQTKMVQWALDLLIWVFHRLGRVLRLHSSSRISHFL